MTTQVTDPAAAPTKATVAAQPRRGAPRKAAAKNRPTQKKAATPRKTAANAAKSKKAPASKKAAAPRAESKTAVILSLVGRKQGATLAAIMAATGWQKHSVRGFISLAQSKRGLKIESGTNKAGERLYKLAK